MCAGCLRIEAPGKDEKFAPFPSFIFNLFGGVQEIRINHGVSRRIRMIFVSKLRGKKFLLDNPD